MRSRSSTSQMTVYAGSCRNVLASKVVVAAGTSVWTAETICASVFSGHDLAATALITASASVEPSVPTMSRIGPDRGNASQSRVTRTEHVALWISSSDTLPSNNRATGERPCEPTTIKSGCHQSALSNRIFAGDPQKPSAEIVHCGQNEAILSAASRASFSAPSNFDRQDSSDSASSMISSGRGILPSATQMTSASDCGGSPALRKSSIAASAQLEPS